MEHKTKRTRLSKEEAITVMQKFCAYQERSQQEVRSRLIEHQVYGHAVEEIIAELITQDFINEERFAQAYTRGKFRIKKWGKHKILAMLKFHKISPYSIKKAFLEIANDEYFDTLKSILIHKNPIKKAPFGAKLILTSMSKLIF